ncbi:F-box/kelch-repeat protein At3g23880-like [Vicia villosa]|uniref:F-box/kelch-repeat protein At3g23880-like n=1 Tax=Vicia villosa TaxID=3911 RepID=UPI00273AB565|nr:F-box/kelch-repeat protein At3g23880-like [Vicia villosa]XP_058758019.1 F-box/kelch-repeat protein At3g23880-like [Vicia villosa]XP_058758020.1 F-box/kelch-repeat protein At3g23880-like [Vicia villosa]
MTDDQNDAASSSSSQSTQPPLFPHAPHLPLDLVAEILCKLPVKHLLQLRLVSISWNSLISHNPEFSAKHLRCSTSNHNRHHLILNSTLSSRHFILSHSPISSFFSSTSPITVTRFTITHSLDNGNNGRGRGDITTCDGIICFGIDESLALSCNPSIRKFKLLPPLKINNSQSHQTHFQNLYTLLYDRFTGNYKIFSVACCNSEKQVNVHTLGTDYWRRIQDFPCGYIIPKPGVFVSDTVNWLACDDTSFAARVIVSLDLENELYRKLSPPPFYDIMAFEVSITLGVLRGCLSMLSYSDKFSNVWIMKEYGNEKSWTKLFSVPRMEEWGVYVYTKALYVSEDEQVLMECLKMGKYSLVVYDSRNNTFKIPKFQNYNQGSEMTAEVYVESLISPL